MTADLTLPAASPDALEADPEKRRRRRKIVILLLLLGLLAVLLGIAIWYLLFRQPLPLPLPTNVDLPGYSSAYYGSETPIGVAVSPDGDRIYVAQSEGDRVVVILDGRGSVIGTAQPSVDADRDHVPVWLAIDPLTSELYVSDRPTGNVYVYDRDGAFLRTLALAEPLAGWQPMGLAFDAAGNLYVADLAGEVARIEMFDREMNLVRTFGEGDALSFPNGIAVDKDGNVFVADSNNGRLRAYAADGTLVAQIARGSAEGQVGLPRGIAVDGRNRIYVGDATAHGVHVFQLTSGSDPDLEYLGFFGGQGAQDGKFSFPNGVAADSRGRLYVADTRNDRIQLWSY